MGVPILIFVVLLGLGVYASSRWLPELPPGVVGGLAFFAVCGLLGAALALLGLHIYGTVEDARRSSGYFRRLAVTGGLSEILFEPAVLLGLAAGLYALAAAAPTPASGEH